MGLWDLLHGAVDWLMSTVRLGRNGQIGWKTFNRKNGVLEREQQPIWKKLKLLLLFNPVTEWIDTTHLMRLYIHDKSVAKGKQEGTPASHRQISTFVDSYHINMNDFDPSDIGQYPTFEDFFIRKHRAGSRPISKENDDSQAIVVADSRVVVYKTIGEAKKLWIKGVDFTMTQLVMDVHLGEHFRNASVASFRLSPQDYHRYHSPVSGTIKHYRGLPGDYYQVDPVALSSKVDILTRNRREYVVIETEAFGDVLFVAIGATDVGTIEFHKKWSQPGTKIQKGEELGYFQFGGSSIIVAFQEGKIRFDDDLLGFSKHRIQVSVEVGMSLGQALSNK